MQEQLDRAPKTMRIRRQTAEHPFGTIKAWMGATHFHLRTLEKVRTEMSLHVLAYNLKRMIASAQEGLNRPEQQRQQHEAANVREC
jgi:transposase